MANSKYKKKVIVRERAAAQAPSQPVAVSPNNRRYTSSIISAERFAQAIEYGLAERYRDGGLHVTELQTLPFPSGAQKKLHVGRKDGDGFSPYSSMAFHMETVITSKPGAWHEQTALTVPVGEAIRVAASLGIRQFTNAKAWEDLAAGNHAFFGWSKSKGLGVLAKLQERAFKR